MLSKDLCFYCQKCLAANPFGEELCVRCGTRLMLVVEPAASRYEGGGLRATHEEHLLERVSALENMLGRITDKLGQMLDLLLRQARNSYMDHVLLETLIGVLSEAGTVDKSSLDKLWRERCNSEVAEQEALDRRQVLRTKILASYSGKDRAEFEELISKGLNSSECDEEEAVEFLEQAWLLSVSNGPLLSLLGEKFFELGEYRQASFYLSQARMESLGDARLCLLLGLCMGAEEDGAQALKLLRRSIELGGSSYAAHYALGRLLASKGEWRDALSEFSLAIEISPSAEAHCIVGCVYFELDSYHLAARYLRSALKLDRKYAAAHFILGLIHLRVKKIEEAKKSIQKALDIEPENLLYKKTLRRIEKDRNVDGSVPVFDFGRSGTKNLIFCCDERLNSALRKSALEFKVETRIEQ
ncbi:MAG TPA: tetratricopeptide repeat protein [Pyrinomonadaceae bacterium]|nr:tetratricopeptide repeat protein [Pyrinomonadaceae bacterium]